MASIFSPLTKNIGIDLGTSTVQVYVEGRGVVLSEPSVMATDERNSKMIAVGRSAEDLLSRSPETVKLHRPLVHGVIADYMHLGGNNDDEKVQLLIQYLRNMNDELNIPHCIKHYGPDSFPTENGFVPENVFLERLPEIAKNAIADACTGSNPRQPSQEEMEKLLKCCYYDTEVDF